MLPRSPLLLGLVVENVDAIPPERVRELVLQPMLPERENRVALDFFECSDTARALRLQGAPIPNRPKEHATWVALENLARELLEPIAAAFGVVTITYGFAGPELIRAVRKRAKAEGRLSNISPVGDQHAGHELNTKGNAICSRGGAAVDLKVAGIPSMEWPSGSRGIFPSIDSIDIHRVA
jgi:hypothetical protein